MDLKSLHPCVLIAVFMASLAIRYGVMAGGLTALTRTLLRRQAWQRRLQKSWPRVESMLQEALWSTSTFLLLGCTSALVFWANESGWITIYRDAGQHGWLYFALVTAGLVVGYDTFFYWTHRLFHTKWLFRHLHVIHHQFRNPSPFCAFSFHPLEALLGGATFVPLVAALMPVPALGVALFVVLTAFVNIYGHMGVEFFPAGFARRGWIRWFNTCTHHNMHHSHVHCNFSLYFNFWDRWLGTNHPNYVDRFLAVASGGETVDAEAAPISARTSS